MTLSRELSAEQLTDIFSFSSQIFDFISQQALSKLQDNKRRNSAFQDTGQVFPADSIKDLSHIHNDMQKGRQQKLLFICEIFGFLKQQCDQRILHGYCRSTNLSTKS